MKLLVVFLISVVVGQVISVGIGLLVERQVTPYAGLVTFIACYFAMFWLAWRFAVRITEPGSRVPRPQDESLLAGERGKPTGVLLGAYVATEGLGQAPLLI
jgi:membrane protein implicated in regulation of membrane protease activity